MSTPFRGAFDSCPGIEFASHFSTDFLTRLQRRGLCPSVKKRTRQRLYFRFFVFRFYQADNNYRLIFWVVFVLSFIPPKLAFTSGQVGPKLRLISGQKEKNSVFVQYAALAYNPIYIREKKYPSIYREI